MIIKENLLFEGSEGEKHMYALFDSGATFSCINENLASELTPLVKLWRPMRVETAAVGHFLEIKYRVVLDFYLHDVRLSDEFMVVPGLSEDVILGVNTFQKWKLKLDFEHDQVLVDPKVAKAMLK